MKRITCKIFVIFLFLHNHTFAKKGITDTVYVSFGISDSIPVMLKIDTITDNRDSLMGNVINIYEKKKYLFIPYDIYECTEKPLVEEIQQSYVFSTESYPSCQLQLNRFTINGLYKSFSYGRRINAQVGIQITDSLNKQQFSGKLIYDTYYTGKKKTATQKALDLWKNELATDLNLIAGKYAKNEKIELYNLH